MRLSSGGFSSEDTPDRDSNQVLMHPDGRRSLRDRHRPILFELRFNFAAQVGAFTDNLDRNSGQAGILQLLLDTRLILRPGLLVSRQVVYHPGHASDVPGRTLRQDFVVVIKDLAEKRDGSARTVGLHATQFAIRMKLVRHSRHERYLRWLWH
jgi:hypothetical protein